VSLVGILPQRQLDAATFTQVPFVHLGDDLLHRSRHVPEIPLSAAVNSVAAFFKPDHILIPVGACHALVSTPLRAEIGDFAVGRQVEAVNPASVLGHERVVGNPRHRLTAPFQRT